MNNVSVSVFDTALLQLQYPEWPALDRDQKYRLLKSDLDRARECVDTSNVTCVEFHQWLAQVINPEINIEDSVAKLHVGNGGTTTSASDTELNNKVAEIELTDVQYEEANELSEFDIFVDSTQVNGFTLNELALVSESGRFLNHAPIDPDVQKTNSKTLVIEVVLQFG